MGLRIQKTLPELLRGQFSVSTSPLIRISDTSKFPAISLKLVSNPFSNFRISFADFISIVNSEIAIVSKVSFSSTNSLFFICELTASRSPWMNMLCLCLLLGYALGIPLTSSYPLPHGVFHIVFMHREPPLLFPSFVPPYNISEQHSENILCSRDKHDQSFRNSMYSPMRTLYHDLMNDLDRSIGSVEQMDQEYNEIMEHKGEDPWVHFIPRPKTLLTEPKIEVNTSMTEPNKEANMTHTTEIGGNPRLLGNHTKGIPDRINGNSSVSLKTNVNDNTTTAAKMNGTNSYEHNIAVKDTIEAKTSFSLLGSKKIELVKRVRRHFNESKLETETNTTNAEQLNGSLDTIPNPLNMSLVKQNEIQWNGRTSTQGTLQTDNQTREIVNFTSTVEKMIELIDKQLENKTQALLKRMKRVMEIKDNYMKDNIGSYVKYNVTKNNGSNLTEPAVESTLTKENSKENDTNNPPDTTENLTKENDTNNPPDTTENLTKENDTNNPPDTTENLTKENDTNNPPDTTKNESKTIETTRELEPVATLANTTTLGEHYTNTTQTIPLDSNANNQTKSPSLKALSTIQTEPKPVLSTRLFVENVTNEGSIKIDSTEQNTGVNNGIIPGGHTVDTNSLSRTIIPTELNVDTHSPLEILVKTADNEYDDNENEHHLRNVLDSNPDEMTRSMRTRDEDQVTSGDLMTALVIPVFLVVLMGSILYAMHNMSLYVINYIGESNTDRTNQDSHELRTLIVNSPANQNTNTSSSNENNDDTNNPLTQSTPPATETINLLTLSTRPASESTNPHTEGTTESTPLATDTNNLETNP
ncbi:hypothetical protein WDU94_012662 [Cyamophila willieti]